MKTYILMSVTAWQEAQGTDTLTSTMIRAESQAEAAHKFMDLYPRQVQRILQIEGIVIAEIRPDVLHAETSWAVRSSD